MEGLVKMHQGWRYAFNGSHLEDIGVGHKISWIACIGVAAGLCFKSYKDLTVIFNGFLLVLVNGSYIFFASAITYIISCGDAFSQEDLKKLRSTTSKLMAATLTGIGVNISAIIRFSIERGPYHYVDVYAAVALGCSFSFIWLLILGPLTQRYYSKWNAFLKFGVDPIVQGRLPPQAAAYPVTPFGIPQQHATTAARSLAAAQMSTRY
ncbi:uncharacterized protein [Macrobrachium rosenbergii]|uniref:uncharacterized protein n=1 Tax=Macrobrachium rosenbergii TaxID=79674 RepID=UPI0034D75BCC